MKLTIFIIIVLGLQDVLIFAQSSEIEQKFRQYNTSQINDQVYIQTDRDVYYQGDTIWFKAYIRSKLLLGESKLSSVFNISLLSDKGLTISSGRYVIFDSKTNGQILLDKHLKEGFYYLFSYTSWMENFSYKEIYRKKIYIRNDIDPNYKIVPFFNKEEYYPGEDIKLKLQCYNNYNTISNDLEFKYKLVADNNKIKEGTSKEEEINFTLDSSFKSSPVISIKSLDSDINLDTIIKIPVNRDLDIAFFPEGGHCINGLEGQVAFKAMYGDGRPANLSGKILDENGKLVAYAITQFDGMGVFKLRPEKGKKYFLETDVKVPPASRFELPQSYDEGWQLKVTQSKSNLITVEIENPSKLIVTGILSLQIRNIICFYKTFNIDNRLIVTIPTDSLPPGIAVLTLFDKNFRPRAERLIFVNYQSRNNLAVKTDSSQYHPRDSTFLHITLKNRAGNPISGNFSLTVYNDELGSTDYLDEPDIIAASYLSLEIRGKVLHPNYYFQSRNVNVKQHLDLLLLTQGWRDYKYLSYPDSIKIPVSQDRVSGYIKKLKFRNGMVPAKGTISLFYCGNATKIKTDNHGFFTFNPIFEKGYNPNIFITAIDSKDNSQVELYLDIQNYQNETTSHLKLILDSLNANRIIPIYTFKSILSIPSFNSFAEHWIDEVVVKERSIYKKDDDFLSLVEKLPGVRKVPDGIIKSSKDIKEVLNSMGIKINQAQCNECCDVTFLPKGYSVNSSCIGYIFNSLICRATNYAEIDKIRTEDIKYFYFGIGDDVMSFTGAFFSVFIFMKNPDLCPIYGTKTTSYVTLNFEPTKEFYSPKYSSEGQYKNPISDFRRTIYWEPNIITNENGEAVIKFYNADQTAKIKCLVEGFGSNNIPTIGESLYEVIDKY